MTTRIVKPDQIALLHKPIVWADGRVELCLALGLLFPFAQPQAVGSEQALWALVGAALPDGVLDQCDPKPRAEVLAAAAAFSPRPVEHLTVRLNLATIDKRLEVTGDRAWEAGFLGLLKPGPATPFTALPLGWDRAFGSPSFAENPLGVGHKPQAGDLLPNVTYPGDSLSDVLGKLRPAGFGAIGFDWLPRRNRRGKPANKKPPADQPLGALPATLQPELFLIAPEDQWLDGYLQGDEPFTLEHLHPEQPVLQGHLPGLRLRCFVRQTGKGFHEVPLALDTVWLVPAVEQGIILAHGTTAIAAPEFRDIEAILCAFERSSDAKRPVAFYLDALNRRLDPNTGALAQLEQADIRPAGWQPLPDPRGIPPLRTRRIHKPALPRATAERMAAQAALLASIKPAATTALHRHDPQAAAIAAELKILASQRPNVPAEIARQQKHAAKLGQLVRAQVASKQAQAEAKARAALARMGLDYTQVAAKAARTATTDPAAMLKHFDSEINRLAATTTNAAVKAALSSIGLAGQIPQVQAAMARLEAGRKQQMALLGHVLKPADQGEDLTGVDLSGQDLSGRDFSHANLTGANLTGAKLVGANLGGAILHGTLLVDADLSEATLSETTGKGGDFSGATLVRTLFLKSRLQAPLFIGATLTETIIDSCQWPDADLSGAIVTKPLFSRSTLPGLKLDGATGSRLMLIGGAAPGLSAIGADLPGFTMADGTDLTGANFTQAVLIGANFHTAILTGAIFVEAQASESNFAHAIMIGANMAGLRARGAAFMGADLTEAILDGADLLDANFGKANLTNASARGANLHGIEASQTIIEGLDFEGANIARSRIEPS